jgi:hypothetical protein
MPRSTRLILSLLLAVGVGMFVVATIVGSGEGSDSTLRNTPSVERVSPGDGDIALQQARVLIDFAPGVNGELVSVGGVLIPTSAQSRTGAAEEGGPGSAAPGGTVDGPAVWFTPGDTMTGADAIMDALPLGEVCAVARYWPAQVPDDILTVRWCFRVT